MASHPGSSGITTMSVNDAILKQLQEMGIEWNLARAAAQRYHSVDAAVNWCFGPGADVRPYRHDKQS